MHKVHAERSENVLIELQCRSTRGAGRPPVSWGDFCVLGFLMSLGWLALKELSSTASRF